MDELKIREQISSLLIGGKYETIKKILLENWETVKRSNDLTTVFNLISVCEQERNAGQRTIFEKVKDMEKLIERYTKLKFYLRRIEFGVIDNGMSEFNVFLVRNSVSSYELLTSIRYNVIHKDKVLQIIQRGI